MPTRVQFVKKVCMPPKFRHSVSRSRTWHSLMKIPAKRLRACRVWAIGTTCRISIAISSKWSGLKLTHSACSYAQSITSDAVSCVPVVNTSLMQWNPSAYDLSYRCLRWSWHQQRTACAAALTCMEQTWARLLVCTWTMQKEEGLFQLTLAPQPQRSSFDILVEIYWAPVQ